VLFALSSYRVVNFSLRSAECSLIDLLIAQMVIAAKKMPSTAPATTSDPAKVIGKNQSRETAQTVVILHSQ
jgi:hypothetical protein